MIGQETRSATPFVAQGYGLLPATAPNPGSRAARVRRAVARGLRRMLGIGAVDDVADRMVVAGVGEWSAWLAIHAAAMLLVAAVAATLTRRGEDFGYPLYVVCVASLFFPVAMRLMLPDVSRRERITVLMIATIGLFALRVVRAPLYFIGHDEYLHWVTAQHIVQHEKLFTPNVLFPIGPLFPGLEIATTALSELSGQSIFVSSLVLLAIARVLFVGSLFLFYERVTKSARIGALSCLFYMGSSTFVYFDTYFSYASLAMPLFAFALMQNAEMAASPRRPGWLPQASFLLTAVALSMTHHVTAYALAGILASLTVLQWIDREKNTTGRQMLTATLVAVLVPMIWSRAMGSPGGAYLGPVFQNGIREVLDLVHSGGERKFFTSEDGVVAPFWQRATALGSVLAICAGLALGFFRSFSLAGWRLGRGEKIGFWRSALGWNNGPLMLLTLLTLLYPVSVVFRMTKSGWEIGNRIGPFDFVGVGAVLAICVATSTQGGSSGRVRAAVNGALASVILIGGIISGESRILVPARYLVSADAASIEPMGVAAAQWTREWLGEANHFVADRVNRLLLSTFGGQLVSTTLQHGEDAGVPLVTRELGDHEIAILRQLEIDFLFADLRLTTARPVYGIYFDGGEADKLLTSPPLPASMLKFNSIPAVSRIFDNGYSIIYDVRALSGRL